MQTKVKVHCLASVYAVAVMSNTVAALHLMYESYPVAPLQWKSEGELLCEMKNDLASVTIFGVIF